MNNPDHDLASEAQNQGANLSAKRAIVVGASSGIGAAVAAELAKRGYAVCLLARRADVLAERCAEISASLGDGAPKPIWRQVDSR